MYRESIKAKQAELNRLCEKGGYGPVAVVLEGRDTAGKTSTIRRLQHYMNPHWYRVFKAPALSTEGEEWFDYWARQMPEREELVFFDRSWYTRAVMHKIRGWCTDEEYDRFMDEYLEWEHKQDVTIIKFWLSIDKSTQEERLQERKVSPLKRWKFTENDAVALDLFDNITKYKRCIFESGGGIGTLWT